MSKKKKRDTVLYPALRKDLNLKTRQDEIEVDYADKLTTSELEWLNKFNEEFVNANMDRKKPKKNLHKTKKFKKEIDARNYDRKKCAYTQSKARGGLKFLEDLDPSNTVLNTLTVEDNMELSTVLEILNKNGFETKIRLLISGRVNKVESNRILKEIRKFLDKFYREENKV